MANNESSLERLVARFLQALGNNDAEGVEALFADDIDWYVPGHPDLPWTGLRSKGSQVAEYFHTMWPHFDSDKSRVQLDKLVLSGEDAVIFATFAHTARSTGRSFVTPAVLHLVAADGRFVRMHLSEDTEVVARAFFD
ncbi:nuclear transport factor 2 family protein [Arthrobacter sp. MSA 4-2]|uniref:nuclear transport factor 2 family protein n=1 Tax=Arthrobacter sp. MSA 4-2 TaxID=2794349 RepID=UPI0018E808CD|nr:nuclear transport factor 2 family protein [Arthrobacter sp. MSA 4-2]MBJ2122282.1 nuclear transport factor 2 family protein [Arthrobacter sp. MSA 4-2]